MKRILYVFYRIGWRMTHMSRKFKGCSPVCYYEWLDNEYEEDEE